MSFERIMPLKICQTYISSEHCCMPWPLQISCTGREDAGSIWYCQAELHRSRGHAMHITGN